MACCFLRTLHPSICTRSTPPLSLLSSPLLSFRLPRLPTQPSSADCRSPLLHLASRSHNSSSSPLPHPCNPLLISASSDCSASGVKCPASSQTACSSKRCSEHQAKPTGSSWQRKQHDSTRLVSPPQLQPLHSLHPPLNDSTPMPSAAFSLCCRCRSRSPSRASDADGTLPLAARVSTVYDDR
jgi:hypothetical protein